MKWTLLAMSLFGLVAANNNSNGSNTTTTAAPATDTTTTKAPVPGANVNKTGRTYVTAKVSVTVDLPGNLTATTVASTWQTAGSDANKITTAWAKASKTALGTAICGTGCDVYVSSVAVGSRRLESVDEIKRQLAAGQKLDIETTIVLAAGSAKSAADVNAKVASGSFDTDMGKAFLADSTMTALGFKADTAFTVTAKSVKDSAGTALTTAAPATSSGAMSKFGASAMGLVLAFFAM